MKRKLVERAGFPAILLVAALAKILAGRAEGPFGSDANYYYQIARHVASGDGLLTSVSLYFEGLHLPARSLVYPLWPLLLGGAGRLVGLPLATTLLPRILYLADLVLFYLLCLDVVPSFEARALQPREGNRRLSALLLTAILAFNATFFAVTTHPYTESLAFALCFSALIAVRTRDELRGAALAGFFSALSFLARTQMICVVLGVFFALLLDASRSRRIRPLLAFGAASAVPVSIWIWVSGYAPVLGWIVPGRRTVQADLPRFSQWVDAGGFMANLVDRLSGVVVAFNPWLPFSYFNSFGVAALLPPAAIVLYLTQWRRTLPSEAGGGVLTKQSHAVLAAGVLFFVTLLAFHARFFLPWLFGWRHGLPFILLLIPAIAFLVSSGSLMRLLATVAVLVSVLTGGVAIAGMIRQGTAQPLTSGEREYAGWAARQPAGLTLLSTHAQSLSFLTRQQYHWTDCSVSPTQTVLMIERLPIDYVVAYESETGCPYLEGLGRWLSPRLEFGSPGERLYLLQPVLARSLGARALAGKP